MCVACLQPGMSPSTPTSLYVSPALSGTHTPPAPSNKAFRSELWAAGVTPDTDTGVATALPVHSRISGFGGKRLAATWLGARAPLVGLTTEAGVPPWGLKLGTRCPLCDLGSHGPRQSPVAARPPRIAAESRSPGFAQAPRSRLSHRRMNCRILLEAVIAAVRRLSLSQAIHSIPSRAVILSPCWGSWLEEQGSGGARGAQNGSCLRIIFLYLCLRLLQGLHPPLFPLSSCFVCGRFCAHVSQCEVAETREQPWLLGLGLHLLRIFETGSLIGLGLTSSQRTPEMPHFQS